MPGPQRRQRQGDEEESGTSISLYEEGEEHEREGELVMVEGGDDDETPANHFMLVFLFTKVIFFRFGTSLAFIFFRCH